MDEWNGYVVRCRPKTNTEQGRYRIGQLSKSVSCQIRRQALVAGT
jgi:hypothetical protein